MNSNEIDKILMKSNVDKEQLIEIMYSALSIMQHYNGNTADFCVEKVMKDHNLIHSKDKIKFGIGMPMSTDTTLYVQCNGIYKEFSPRNDSWKTVSFVYDVYNGHEHDNPDNYFIIDKDHDSYPILKHLIDNNTVDDEINNEKD